MDLVRAQKAVEELLECSICMNSFSNSDQRTPKMLPCQHSFCFECVKNVHQGTRLCCPACRKTFLVTLEDIPNSFVLLQLLDTHSPAARKPDEKGTKCTECQRVRDDVAPYCGRCIDDIVGSEIAKAIEDMQRNPETANSNGTERIMTRRNGTENADPIRTPRRPANRDHSLAEGSNMLKFLFHALVFVFALSLVSCIPLVYSALPSLLHSLLENIHFASSSLRGSVQNLFDFVLPTSEAFHQIIGNCWRWFIGFVASLPGIAVKCYDLITVIVTAVLSQALAALRFVGVQGVKILPGIMNVSWSLFEAIFRNFSSCLSFIYHIITDILTPVLVELLTFIVKLASVVLSFTVRIFIQLFFALLNALWSYE